MQQHLHRRRWALLVLVCLVLGPLVELSQPREVEAAMSVPVGFVNERVVTSLTEPTAMVWDKTGRMYIAQKGGQVRVIQNDTLLIAPFIDLTAEVNPANDRGLLGIALHPDFPDTPYIYLLYVYDPPELTATSGNGAPNGNGARTSRLMRVEADAAQNYAVEKAGTRTIILGKNSTFANSGDIALDIGNSSNAGSKTSCTNGANQPIEDCIPADIISHSIGTLMFAPDGSLFVSNGDASSYSFQDVRSLRAQDLNSLAGKILRINPDTGEGYADNPFFNTTVDTRDRQSAKTGSRLCDSRSDNCARVWDYGLRNPFRFTLKPGTSEVYIGDVGWSTWEEINAGKGKNFGWPCYEGNNTGSNKAGGNYPTYQSCKDLYTKGSSAVTAPVYSWSHAAGGASANGGAFYTGTSYPAQYQGKQFFTDYNRKWIKYITYDANGAAVINDFATETDPGTDGVPQVTMGPDGSLYYIRLGRGGSGTGEIRRIRYTGSSNVPPTAQLTADKTSGAPNLKVTFSAAKSTDTDQPVGTPLTYLWNFGDKTTGSGITASHTYTTTATRVATLQVIDQNGAIDTDAVTITVGNTAPTATITSPALGTLFNGGQTLNFTGAGSDAEDGQIPGNQLAWSFYLHHSEHVHVNYYPDAVGANGSIVLPDDHGSNFWLEICLTATDKQGLSSPQNCQEYYFNTVNNNFRTDPPNLTISDGNGVYQQAPFTSNMVVNGVEEVVAPDVQQHLSFSAWTDGVTTAERFIRAGATPQTFTASYINKPPVALLGATPQTGQPLSRQSFSGALSFDPEDQTDGLSYTWSFGDGQSGSGATLDHTYPGPGSYTATLTVTDILGATSGDKVVVGVPNTAPMARIELPANTTTYRIGTPISVHSGATDTEDGTLTGNDLKWDIIRYHGGVSETLQTFTGVDGTFTVSERKATTATHPLLAARRTASDDDRIEVRLTALDHNGGVSTTSTWLDPQRVTLTLQTSPVGLAISVNGAAQTAPGTQTLIAGTSIEVSTPDVQTLNGATYNFSGWSDGGARQHTVVVNVDTTLTANYTQPAAQPAEQPAAQPAEQPAAQPAEQPTAQRQVVWLPLMTRKQ